MSFSEPSESEICIGIGGITLALSTRDPGMRIELEGDMGRFKVQSTAPDLAVKAAWGDLSRRRDGECLFDSGGAWKLYGTPDACCFHCTASQFGDVPYKVARLNHDFTSADVLLHRPFFKTGLPLDPLQYPLDEVLILNLLSRGRGVEMHACGVVDESGGGLLFSGESGAGKTTMARLWMQEHSALILSDDRIILRRGEGGIWMYGTPWHGEANLASNSRAPLKAVFFLRHGRRNRLREVRGANAAAELFARSFPVMYSTESLSHSLEFYDHLTQVAPCYDFEVVPNPQVLDFLQLHKFAL